MYQKEIREYLDAHKEEMLEDICSLVKIDSARTEAKEGMPFGEGAAKALEEGSRILEKYGFAVKNYENYALDTRMNGMPLQLDILAHLDVVPAGEDWTVTEPFAPVLKDGCLYGRGTADDKGPAIAALYAMRAIRDLKLPVTKDVRLILGSDEECGSSDIAYYFTKTEHAPMAISPDADFPLIFLEKGSLHTSFTRELPLDGRKPYAAGVQAGVKVNVVPARAKAVIVGMTKEEAEAFCQAAPANASVTCEAAEDGCEIRVQGVGAHASSPMDGVNALTCLLSILAKLPLAESDRTDAIRKAAELFPHGDFHGAALGVNHEDEISGKLTLTLDMFRLDEKGMEGIFDCRACVSANDENTRQVIYRRFEEAGFSHDESEMNPPHYVPKDSLLVRTLLTSYEKITGRKEEPLAIGGGTYVHHIENGVACGCADPSVDNHMHGPDEFVKVEQLIMSAQVFADAILELCR